MEQKLSQVVCVRMSEETLNELTTKAKREKRKLRTLIRLILEENSK